MAKLQTQFAPYLSLQFSIQAVNLHLIWFLYYLNIFFLCLFPLCWKHTDLRFLHDALNSIVFHIQNKLSFCKYSFNMTGYTQNPFQESIVQHISPIYTDYWLVEDTLHYLEFNGNFQIKQPLVICKLNFTLQFRKSQTVIGYLFVLDHWKCCMFLNCTGWCIIWTLCCKGAVKIVFI